MWPFLLFPGLVASIYFVLKSLFLSAGFLALLIVIASLIALYLDRIQRPLCSCTDLDSESSNLFNTFTRSFDLLMQSTKIWTIQAQGHQSDWKRNAGCHHNAE